MLLCNKTLCEKKELNMEPYKIRIFAPKNYWSKFGGFNAHKSRAYFGEFRRFFFKKIAHKSFRRHFSQKNAPKRRKISPNLVILLVNFTLKG
jgi:hypothetical protein